MGQVACEFIEQSIDDKQGSLLFVFSANPQQCDAFAVSGLKVMHLQAGQFTGSEPQSPQQRDHGVVSQPKPGALIEGVEQLKGIAGRDGLGGLPLAFDQQRQDGGRIRRIGTCFLHKGKKAFQSIMVIFQTSVADAGIFINGILVGIEVSVFYCVCSAAVAQDLLCDIDTGHALGVIEVCCGAMAE